MLSATGWTVSIYSRRRVTRTSSACCRSRPRCRSGSPRPARTWTRRPTRWRPRRRASRSPRARTRTPRPRSEGRAARGRCSGSGVKKQRRKRMRRIKELFKACGVRRKCRNVNRPWLFHRDSVCEDYGRDTVPSFRDRFSRPKSDVVQ